MCFTTLQYKISAMKFCITPLSPPFHFLFVLSPFSSTVFIPSCLCWQPPAASVSFRGPATVRGTLPPTQRGAKLWCQRRRTDKTTHWVCGGPGHSALLQRGTQRRVLRWRRPESLLVQAADTNWVTPAMWYLFQAYFCRDKVCYGSVSSLCHQEHGVLRWGSISGSLLIIQLPSTFTVT